MKKMSKGINRVILIGNLGKDPEEKKFDSTSMTTFSLATTDSWKDKITGEKKINTEWHRISVFNKLGEIAFKYLKKGSKIYLEGSIKYRKYVDKSGADKFSTEIIANNIQILSSSSYKDENTIRAPDVKEEVDHIYDTLTQDMPF